MAACLTADWLIVWRIRIGSWGGGSEDNLPLNSLATVIRPSGLAGTHLHIHGNKGIFSATKFLLVANRECAVAVRVKLLSNDGMSNFPYFSGLYCHIL